MDLDGVRQCLKEGYERINGMKNSIAKVEACRHRLKLKEERVQKEMTHMMNRMAEKLYKLQQSMENTVKDSITQRERLLDAKKKEIHEGYTHLVQVCVEADKVLRGRSTDILGRSCQRLFSKFETAKIKLNMAEKFDTESVLGFEFQDNSREFLSNVCVARLKHFGKSQTVTEVDEFWVDYQLCAHSCNERRGADGISEIDLNCSNSLPKQPLETIQEVPEDNSSQKGHRTEAQCHGPQSGIEVVHICEKDLCMDIGCTEEHFPKCSRASKGSATARPPPQSDFNAANIDDKDLPQHNKRQEEYIPKCKNRLESSPAVLPPPGFSRVQRGKMDIQRNVLVQPDLSNPVSCPSSFHTHFESGGAIWIPDNLSDAYHRDDTGYALTVSPPNTSKVTGPCSASVQGCDDWPRPVDKEDKSFGRFREVDNADFVWLSDDSDSEYALKPIDPAVTIGEDTGHDTFPVVPETCSGAMNLRNIDEMTYREQNLVEDKQDSDDSNPGKCASSYRSTQAAHESREERRNVAEAFPADIKHETELDQGSSYSAQMAQCTEREARKETEYASEKEVYRETDHENKMIKKEPVEADCDSDSVKKEHEEAEWTRTEHDRMKKVHVEAEPVGTPGKRGSEIARPIKTRCKRLDLSHMLEHTGGNMLEIPAKCIEIIEGGFELPIGLCTNSKGDVIIADTSNHEVKVVNNGRVITHFGAGLNMRRPSAVVVNEKDEMFVKDDHCVYHFDADGKFVKTIGKRQMNTPYGLAITKEGELVIVDALYSNARMHICGQDGQISTYPYQPLNARFSDSKCRFLTVHGEHVLTSDLGRSCLYMTNLKGELEMLVGKFGRRPGELNQPAGITCDSVGNWIVADSKNHRVQVFAPNGFFMAMLRPHNASIHRPSGIHLTSDGLLYVINYVESVIKVFKLGAS